MTLEQLLGELDPSRWPAGWRDDWEFREGAKPVAQAWHRSGLCFLVEYKRVDEQGNYGWVIWDSDISQSRIGELQRDMGQEAFSKFWKLLGSQATARWYELGYHDKSWRKGPLTAESTLALLGIKTDGESWRQHWEINDNEDNDEALPMAWHRCGLCFDIEFDDIRWVIGTSHQSASREEELLQGLGEAEFIQLRGELAGQLARLWRERGYTDYSPYKMDATAAWRAEWVLHAGAEAKANAVHSSGLGLIVVTDVDMGHVPVWWAIEAEGFADAHARLKRELGEDGFDDFISKRRREALELWYGLGSSNGICPTNEFGTPLSSDARPAPQSRQTG